ncbi:MAG TPA: hypothetical protein VIJ77_02660 [Candidatus Tumulicola sp.]
MSNRRSFFASLAAVAILAGCRGGAGGNALPLTSQTVRGESGAALAGIKFKSLGPTHMSDGLPTSGKVNAYAVNPNNPKIIYMAGGRGTGLETYSSAGILRTTDGGNSWETIDKGLVDSNGRIASVVNSLWIDPANPSVLLAATEYAGIFRTSDGGSTWASVYPTTAATQFVSYGGAVFAACKAGILVSNDDGATWTVKLAGTAKRYPTAFGAVDGASGSALYAGMANGTIYAFSGGKWSKTGKLPYVKQTGTDGSVPAVHQIAVDPYVPATVYASSNDGEWDQDLHASVDGGKTWNTVLESEYYYYGLGTQAIAFSYVHPHRLYIGADGFMYYILGDGNPNPQAFNAANLSIIDLRNVWTSANGSDDACWIASDQGLDYEPTCSSSSGYNDRVVSASSATGLARRFTVSPDGKTLLASMQDFDSHLTTDGGASWQVDGLYEDGFNELRPGDPSVCYAYDEASGLSISTNGCQSFHSSTSDITPSRLMTNTIAFDPKDPLTMYFAAGPNNGPGFYGPKGLYKSTDGGSTISQLTTSIVWPGAIAVDPSNGSHIVVSDMRGKGSTLYVTANAGKTWKKSAGVPPTKFWYAITVSPVDGRTVLASSVDKANNVFVLRSTNGGRSFANVSIVTNAPPLRGHIDRDRTLLITRGQRRERPHEKEEGAKSQAYVYSPEREIRYNQDVTTGKPDVAITTLRGAFVSADDGSTWTRIDDGLVSHSFWGSRWVKGYLYIASDGQGVLRSTKPVQAPSQRWR